LNSATTTTWTPERNGKNETCPVLEKAEPECYCLNMTSLNIPKAVQFCLGDFRQCPIYKKYMGCPKL
jgi:hypothetical protein